MLNGFLIYLYKIVPLLTQKSESQGYQNDSVWSDQGQAQALLYAPSGFYTVSVYLPQLGSNSPLGLGWVKYTLMLDEHEQTRVILDQQQAQNEWIEFGTYALSGGLASLSMRGAEGETIVADAIRFESVPTLTPTLEKEVQPQTVFYREQGVWNSVGQGRQSNDEEAQARYTFSGLTPQRYYLLAQYPPQNNLTDQAEYSISIQGRELTRFRTNQSDSFEGEWKKIGEFFVAGSTTLEIHLINGSQEGEVYAGKIKLVSTECTTCVGSFKSR